MPLHRDYLPGEPCWFAYGVDDPALARHTATLLGWQVEPDGRAQVARVTGGIACSLTPSYGRPGMTVFLATTDLADSLRGCAAHGITPLTPPVPMGAAGSFALVRDVDGSVIGLFHGTAEPIVAVGEPGAVERVLRPAAGSDLTVWHRLCGRTATPDPDRQPDAVPVAVGAVAGWTPLFQLPGGRLCAVGATGPQVLEASDGVSQLPT